MTNIYRGSTVPGVGSTIRGQAEDIDIVDEGNLYDSTNVEDALQEIASDIQNVNAAYNIETLSATKVLGPLDATYQRLDPDGADRTITLDTASAELDNVFEIVNTSTDALYELNVYSGVVLLTNIKSYGWRRFRFNGTAWTDVSDNDGIIGDRASGTAYTSIAVGYEADSGTSGISIGANSLSGDSDVVIGSSARGGTTANVVVGNNAGVTNYPGDDVVLVGTTAKVATAGNSDAVAVGSASVAGASTVAVGKGANGTASSSVAIGVSSSAGADLTVAVGRDAAANGQGGVSVGYSSSTGIGSIAVGNDASATGGQSVAIGEDSSVTTSSTALGWTAVANQVYSVAIGYNSSCGTTSEAISIGADASVTGDRGISVGRSAAAAAGSTSIGYQSVVTGTDSVAVGYQSAVGLFADAVSVGKGSSASESYTVALGKSAQAQAQYSASIGWNTTTAGDHSIALGPRSSTSRTGELVTNIVPTAAQTYSRGSCGWAATVTGTSPTEITLNAAAGEYFTILENSVVAFTILVTCINQTTQDASVYQYKGAIKRITSGNATFVGVPSKDILGEDAAGYDVVLSADTVNQSLKVTVTNATADTHKWVARGDFTEVSI